MTPFPSTETPTHRQEIGGLCLNGTGELANINDTECPAKLQWSPRWRRDSVSSASHLGKVITLPSSWSYRILRFVHSLLWFYPSQLCLYTKLQCSVKIHVGEFLVYPIINAGGQGKYQKLLGWGLTGNLEEGGFWAGRFCPSAGCSIVLLWTAGVNWVVVLVVWGIL